MLVTAKIAGQGRKGRKAKNLRVVGNETQKLVTKS